LKGYPVILAQGIVDCFGCMDVPPFALKARVIGYVSTLWIFARQAHPANKPANEFANGRIPPNVCHPYPVLTRHVAGFEAQPHRDDFSRRIRHRLSSLPGDLLATSGDRID
jgi:hypothetical protein